MIGILSLQGDFAEHSNALHKHGFETMQVKSVEDLAEIDRLVIPGGESTAISMHLESTGLDKALADFDKPIWGTCAGAILMADRIGIEIDRNSYGAQLESFEAELEIDGVQFPAAFIRAPRITEVSDDCEVLIRYNGDPVMVRNGNVLVTTFHPELYEENPFYNWLWNE